MTTNGIDILILGAGWLSHFLLPILHESNLTHAATSRTGLTPGTIQWNLGDDIKPLPKASTVVVMFPVEDWKVLEALIKEYQKTNGDSLWILIGSTRGWQVTDTISDSVVTRHTPLPPNAPARSLVEEQFLKAYPTRGVVLNLVGLHGRPPVSGDSPRSAPRLVPNFLKRIGSTKDALKQKASVHFVHGSDAALAIVLVHQQARGMVGRWIVSDCLARDWWAIALELGQQQEKRWALELMKEGQVAVLPRQKGLGRVVDGSDFWVATGMGSARMQPKWRLVGFSPWGMYPCEIHEPLDVHMGDLRVTFLGTSSGGGPTEGRNCSSLALSIRDEIWLVDCAEGTQRQIHKSRHLNIEHVTKVFITHMHVDHCVGVVPLLSTVMSIFSGRAQSCNNDPNKLHIEIYGTSGLRQFIRSTLNLTHMNLSGKYIVHELHLSEGDAKDQGMPHPNEIVGINIRADSEQFWQNIGGDLDIKIDVGSIEHRVACVGYVFTEKSTTTTIPRRLVCLGDTSSANHIAPLCTSEGIYPSLVVHESTNAWIPPHVDRHRLYGGARKTPQSVREKAISKGHSTPDMAGAFARSVQAERLALIHFSAMFKNPSPSDPIMREIARQATVAWGRRGANAIAAHDLYWIDIPPTPIEPSESQDIQPNSGPSATVLDAQLWDDPLEPDQPMPQNLKRKWDKTHTTGAKGFRGNRNRDGGRGRGRGRGDGHSSKA